MPTTPLRIRPFRPADLDDLADLLADPEVMRHIEPPYSRAAACTFLHQYGLGPNPAIFAVEDASGFAGYVIYHPYTPDSWELGWVLSRAVWGQGYASALTARLIEDARLRTNRLVIECSTAQEATRRIALKHGFTPAAPRDGLDVYCLDLHPDP